MPLTGAMEGLIVVIIGTVMLVANAQSTPATDPFRLVPCYTDRCDVDRMLSCSDREKRCVDCQKYMHDCENPDDLKNKPRECIIHCRHRILAERMRLEYELRLNEAIQAYENKTQEKKQNVQTGEEKEASPQQNQPLCQPSWIFGIVVGLGVAGWLPVLTYLSRCCWKKFKSIRRRKRDASTRGTSQSRETSIAMASSADVEQKAGSQADNYASSGFGSEDTTFPKSRESQLGVARVEREIPRRAHPEPEILRAIPDDFIEQVERTHDKAEEQRRQHRMQQQQQQAQRQQDRNYPEQAEEEQRLLGSQIDDQENQQQQQQQQQQEGRPSRRERPAGSRNPQIPPDDTDYQREEPRDIWQPRRGPSPYCRGISAESRNYAHMPDVGTAGFHSQPEDGTAPSPAAAAVAVAESQGCEDGKKAYDKLMNVNPTPDRG